MIQIGEKIRELRNQKRMTQKDLAEQLNVTAQAVSRWENNEVEPSLETLGQMASIFEITMDELFGKTMQAETKDESPSAAEPEVVYVQT